MQETEVTLVFRTNLDEHDKFDKRRMDWLYSNCDILYLGINHLYHVGSFPIVLKPVYLTE